MTVHSSKLRSDLACSEAELRLLCLFLNFQGSTGIFVVQSFPIPAVGFQTDGVAGFPTDDLVGSCENTIRLAIRFYLLGRQSGRYNEYVCASLPIVHLLCHYQSALHTFQELLRFLELLTLES